MDTQRLQANEDLIEVLVNCSSSEEFYQILNAHQNLIDHELLEVIDEKIAEIEEQDPELEERLQELQDKLTQYRSHLDRFQFLMQRSQSYPSPLSS